MGFVVGPQTLWLSPTPPTPIQCSPPRPQSGHCTFSCRIILQRTFLNIPPSAYMLPREASKSLLTHFKTALVLYPNARSREAGALSPAWLSMSASGGPASPACPPRPRTMPHAPSWQCSQTLLAAGGSARHSPLSCLTVATVLEGLEFVRVPSVVPLSLTHPALALHSADVGRLREEAQWEATPQRCPSMQLLPSTLPADHLPLLLWTTLWMKTALPNLPGTPATGVTVKTCKARPPAWLGGPDQIQSLCVVHWGWGGQRGHSTWTCFGRRKSLLLHGWGADRSYQAFPTSSEGEPCKECC